MATNIMSDIQLVGAGLNYDLQPPAGQEYEVLEIGSSIWVGVAPAAVPQVNVGIFNGVIGPAWILTAVNIRGWNRVQHIHINNANYLRLNNPGGAGENISFSAKVIRSFGAAASQVITQLQTVGAGLNWDIQPPVGSEYHIEDVGSSMWIGAAPAALPDVTVSIFDGAIAAQVAQGADVRGWDKNLDIYLNRNNYLRLTNTNAAQAIIAVVGKVAREFGAGATVVMTDVQTIGAGLNWDVQPAAGQEWLVTEIGSGTWVGVPPLSLPQVTVSMFDGAIASVLLQSTDFKGWLDRMEIYIDNNNYLRINDASGAGQNICISAKLTRQYQ